VVKDKVGVVTALWRFPVKSMRGEAVNAECIYWYGLEGDRRYAFVKTGDMSRFPWLTARDVADLLRFVPRFTCPEDPLQSPVEVQTPDGLVMALESAELRDELARRYRRPVHLMHLGRGTFDSLPISLLSLSTVRAIAERQARPVEAIRFRANILIEAFEDRPHVEDSWLGRSLIVGDRPDSACIRVDRVVPRCMMVNLDPERTVQGPAILRDVVDTNDGNLAVYCSTGQPGTVEVGDTVYVVRDG
jgi:hypothetical protein